ncbi:hypothetical protein GCM10010398_33330 [Streptomyces fimbriatus]
MPSGCRPGGERAGHGEAVLVDVVADDRAVPDGEAQGEPVPVRPPGLPDLTEHHRVRTVGQDPLDPGGRLRGHVVGGRLPAGGGGAGDSVADPGGGAAVLVLGPVEPPVARFRVQLGDAVRVSASDPVQQVLHHGTGRRVGHGHGGVSPPAWLGANAHHSAAAASSA